MIDPSQDAGRRDLSREGSPGRPRRGTGRYANVLTEIDRLHQTNATLRDEIRALDARIADLDARCRAGTAQLDFGAPDAATQAQRHKLARAEVRELVLYALRRLQRQRLDELMTNEDPDDGVAEFTNDEIDTIIATVIAPRRI